jgi:hypothetical protein
MDRAARKGRPARPDRRARPEPLVVQAVQLVVPAVVLAEALAVKQDKKVALKAAQKAMLAVKAKVTAGVKGKDIAASMKAKKKLLTALKCTIIESVSSARVLVIAL